METCNFNKAWQGKCKNPRAGKSEYCKDHKGLKCCVCGKQANRECDFAGQLVCGALLCKDCYGWHDSTLSNLGFLGHRHSKREK